MLRKALSRFSIVSSFVALSCGLSVQSLSAQEISPEIAHFYAGEVSEQRKAQLNLLVTTSATQPADVHPRLYGVNEQWYQNIQRYESLDPNCDWGGKSGWGTIKNIKSEWDRYSLGGQKCETGRHAIPESIQGNKIANQYMTNSISRWRRDDALRMVHLIRRMNYCHHTQQDCVYTPQEIEQLSISFLNYEINRLRNLQRNAAGYFVAWHKGFNGRFFDLGSYPAFKLWTLILDTFWNSELISAEDRQFIFDELENEIDSYIEIYHLPEGASGALGRWAIRNGNNWTPVLNSAALFWAITFWHEDPYKDKAKQVLDIVLESNWFHRDKTLDDGAYNEGPSYLGAAVSGSLEINNLLMASFGQPNHAVKWGLMGEKTSTWMIENVATDGNLVDFGDAWARQGYSDLYILDMLYWEELVGLKEFGSVEADACKLQDLFATSYYLHAFYDTWKAAPHYARDLYSLTTQCQRVASDVKTLIYPTYQMGTIRQHLPGATETATNVSVDNIRNKQADQTFLAGNAVSNTLSHREIDFGSLIWTSFGNRLLSDWGYGELSKPYDFYSIKGGKGQYVASNEHILEFWLRHINGQVAPSKLFVSFKLKGVSREVNIGDYVSNISDNWTKVSIPLSDFGESPAGWSGRGDGIEFLRFRTTGFIRDGEFGIDEIKLIEPQGTEGIVWYGDSHGDSLESDVYGSTPIISHKEAVKLEQIVESGGANNTEKWAKFSATGSYSVISIFYQDQPDEQYVANYMDYLPIGANTLILPKARNESARVPERTHMSQFFGQTGQIHDLDVEGRAAIHMNGGTVYGKHLDNGNLEYFHRYMVPLNGGNYAIVDSFKAKPGKQDYIQEFWYSYKNPDAACNRRTQDVVQSVAEDGSLLLTPRCNVLIGSENVESFGRIKAASMQPGEFVLGAPDFMKDDIYFNRFVEDNGLYMINRLNIKDRRNLARFVSKNEVAEDVRVFLLQASTSAEYAQASVVKTDCGMGACFNIDIEGVDSISLNLDRVEGQYVLPGTNLTEPENEEEEEVEPPVDTGGLERLTPVAFTASHPARVGEPQNLFDEQEGVLSKVVSGAKYPELNQSGAKVNKSINNLLPNKKAIETSSPYARYIYVDENDAPLFASFTIELEKLSSIAELFYYDMSSQHRAGRFIVSVSIDQQNWTSVFDGMTGEYKKWVKIDLANVAEAKYLRFEFAEENSAKGITEVMIYGEKKVLGEEALIQPTNVVSLHPGRLKNFVPLFDEQEGLVDKPLHLSKIPELRFSKPKVNFSNTNDLPMKQAVEVEPGSPYGRAIYVDQNGEPMPGQVVLELGSTYQLNELMYYDMSSSHRPGRVVMYHSNDNENWTPFYDNTTGEYKKWVSVSLDDVDASFIRLDFYEQNASTAMTEMVIVGRPHL